MEKLIELGIYLKEHNITNKQFYFKLTDKLDRNSTDYIERMEQGKIEFPCKIFLDQSTFTGYAIFDRKSRLVTSGVFYKSATTSTGRYKFALKDFLNILIEEYKINEIYYEHVYDEASPQVTEVLNEIKILIKDIELERKLKGDNSLDVFGVDHATWKRELAKPNKFKKTKNDKEEVERHVEMVYPLVISGMGTEYYYENMVDAIGMGVGLAVKQTYSGITYDKLRFNKTLPLDQVVFKEHELPDLSDLTSQEWVDFVSKLRKPFREAFRINGIKLANETKINSMTMDEYVRRYLTYKDILHIVKIPKDYRHWGFTMLQHDIDLSKDGLDTDFYIISARKKRLI